MMRTLRLSFLFSIDGLKEYELKKSIHMSVLSEGTKREELCSRIKVHFLSESVWFGAHSRAITHQREIVS